MKKAADSVKTIKIKEAAEFLGFKSIERLRQKVKRGEIPGAKPGRSWVFLEQDLVNYIRMCYSNKIKGELLCQSLKEKAVHSYTVSSQLSVKPQDVALKCMNQRRKLRLLKRKSTKLDEKKPSNNSSYTEKSEDIPGKTQKAGG